MSRKQVIQGGEGEAVLVGAVVAALATLLVLLYLPARARGRGEAASAKQVVEIEPAGMP